VSVVKAEDAVENFDAWRNDPAFSAIDAHPVYGAFGRRYYPAVFERGRRDESFAIVGKGQPLLLVPCTAGAEDLDYFGFPLRLFPRAGLNPETQAAAIEAAFVHLDGVVAENGLQRVTVGDDTGLGTLSPVGKQCLNRRSSAALRLTGLCDLQGGEAGMRKGLRKSFQSLINWGRKNLEIVVVGADLPDRAMFTRYQDFHRAVAGRTTRPDASWDAMFDWICLGRGELILGFLPGGELVTGTMVVDGTTTSYYASGVYDRDRFDQPLGHWPLWLAMSRAAERGIRQFDLGDLPLTGAASAKEIAIGYFKRGFATTIATSVAWHWTAAPGDRKAAP
jgi:hypothetical protein